MAILTQFDIMKIFDISESAINKLVQTGRLPYQSIQGNLIFFNADNIIKRLKTPLLNDIEFTEKLKSKLWELYPQAMKAIQEYSANYPDVWEPKKYYLNKIKNKKLGFVYYVRYVENNTVIPSHWTTKTNDIDVAHKYAIENKEKLLNRYYNRTKIKKPYGELYTILKNYYTENSEYLKIDIKRGKSIGHRMRITYHNFITKQFIPFLKKNKIQTFNEIDTPLLARLQNYLLNGTDTKPGIKPQTIKIYLLTISNIFNHLVLEGYLKINPYKNLVHIKIRNEKPRGCYEITLLKGVFNKIWKNPFSYILCLIIYTTGMRNIEIERLRVSDIILMNNIHFINIPISKTKNGIRIIPLHEFTYKKITSYIRKTKKKENDYIFRFPNKNKLGSIVFNQANSDLAEYTHYSEERLNNENITFYSGRHYWKTLMNSEKLGDIEEYFMGHRVSNDVSKRYNHKDKQGKIKLIEKSKRVIQILDKHIFK